MKKINLNNFDANCTSSRQRPGRVPAAFRQRPGNVPQLSGNVPAASRQRPRQLTLTPKYFGVTCLRLVEILGSADPKIFWSHFGGASVWSVWSVWSIWFVWSMKSHAHEEPHEQTIEGTCSVRNFCRLRVRAPPAVCQFGQGQFGQFGQFGVRALF